MKTYWDHTAVEKASMTEEDVKLLIDMELMKEGVRKPTPPKLTEVPKCPLGSRKRVFGVGLKGKYGTDETLGVVFKTVEAAQAFIDLGPMKSDYEYEVGSEFRYLLPLRDASVVTEELYSLDQINQFRSEMKQRKAITEQNAKLSSEFEQQSQKAERVTERVWSDWYSAQNRRDTLRSIVTTYGQYLELTKGDIGLALTFLGKLHNVDEIQEAREWFPDSIPESAPPQMAEPVEQLA